MTTTIAWTRYTNICDICRKRFRIDKATLEDERDSLAHALGVEPRDTDVVAVISLCHRCVWDEEGVGEFIEDKPHARRADPKGWALDTLAAMARDVRGHLESARAGDRKRFELRLWRRAFVAQALRDRIDGIV